MSVPAQIKGTVFLLRSKEEKLLTGAEVLGQGRKIAKVKHHKMSFGENGENDDTNHSWQIYAASYKLNIHFNTEIIPCIKNLPWIMFCCYCGVIIKLFFCASLLCN